MGGFFLFFFISRLEIRECLFQDVYYYIILVDDG